MNADANSYSGPDKTARHECISRLHSADFVTAMRHGQIKHKNEDVLAIRAR